MPSLSARHLVVPALAVAIVATASVGVTYAATSRHDAKACETSKGYLALASAKGHCPKHTSKVTLGEQGPRGERGAPGRAGGVGPSDVFVATDRSGTTLSTSDVVASLSLAPGTYAMTGSVELSNAGTVAAAQAACDLVNGTNHTVPLTVAIPAGEEIGPDTEPGEAGMTLSGALTLTTAGTVELHCDGGGALSAAGSLQGVKVNTLTSTGDPNFGTGG
jgi:hypothetical protein